MRTDILLDENYDLIDLGDEWDEGESDQQHIELLMVANKGEFKEFPWIGFGAEKRLKGVFNKKQIVRDVRVELENDGYTQYNLILNNGLSDFKIEI